MGNMGWVINSHEQDGLDGSDRIAAALPFWKCKRNRIYIRETDREFGLLKLYRLNGRGR
jgi:hypothetical protein